MASILVAYASKHGATQVVAERIAETLTTSGHDALALPAKAAGDLSGFDGFVIGGAAYYGLWLKEITEFVRRNQSLLGTLPVWLFSSGPLGTQATDDHGRDKLITAEPKEFDELRYSIKPRGVRVFFGALDPQQLGISERLIRSMPTGRALLPEGDFRDWKEIEAWAKEIAVELTPSRAG